MKSPCDACPFGPNPTSRDVYAFTVRRALVSTLVRLTATVVLLGVGGFTFGVVRGLW